LSLERLLFDVRLRCTGETFPRLPRQKRVRRDAGTKYSWLMKEDLGTLMVVGSLLDLEIKTKDVITLDERIRRVPR